MDIQGIDPQQAWQILQQNPKAVLIDIRSSMEFLFVGHPVGAVHIPWIDEPDWAINPNFVPEVQKLLQSYQIPILICRSGQRSLAAGQALLQAGIQPVYHVDSGFEGDLNEQHQRSTINGWRFAGLPWEQC